MKTKITELLGIEYPIVCGGMMRLAYPPLCAAISEAGGLGNLTSTMYADKEALKKAISEVRQLTSKPFWVNVTMLPAMNVGDAHYKTFFETIAEEQVAAVEIGGTPLDRFAGPRG